MAKLDKEQKDKAQARKSIHDLARELAVLVDEMDQIKKVKKENQKKG